MKKQLQKLSSILLTLVMLLSLLPTTALAADTYTVTVNGGTASPAGPYTVDAEVTVTADPDPEGKKFKEWQIEGLSTTTSESRSIFFYMPANNVTITAIYEDANIIIESASATITEPVAGANPDFNIVSADESKYTVTVVKWNLLDGSSYPVLTADDKFERGESYQLDVKFVANPGYEFSDSCVYNVNGVSRAAYSLTKGERRCYFDVYEIIDTINVKGVVAPVAGATPDVSGITSDTDGINVIDVKWRDKDGYAFEGNPFVAGEKYILWLKYETESDYKVADDAEVTFNISDINILDKEITHPIIKMTYEVPADTTYTVSFDANSGTGTMTPVTGISGEYELPACTFTAPSGKQFKAWSVGGSEKAVGDKITVTADTTVTAVWETVSEYTKKGDISAVTATADIAPVLGAKTSAVSFTITNPTDAAAKGVIFSGTSWYKKDTSSIYGWTQCSNGVDTFEEGTYRLSVQLRSKSNDAKEYYAMSGDTTFTVNGVQWNSEEPFRDYYATDGYGYRFFVSPEFTLGGKTLDSIAVTTPPTTTAYREGEDFNPAGMVVTATYTDSTTAPVVLYTVTDGSALTAGKTTVTISYTEGGVTKTATQTITVAKEYTVTVEGGTGTGKYVAGEEVTISAFVSGGRKFKEWQGTEGLAFTSGDKNSQTATFTMPAHDVTVTAVTGPAEYYVSVSGGSGTGMYETGETVTIVADPPEVGKQFKEWSVGDGKVLRFAEGDITSSTAKFFMPGEAVRISATYEDIPVTTYAITFNANGGSVTPASAETGADGKLTSLPTPTRSGSYSFNGWYTAASGGTKVTTSTIFNANTTIYAQWTYTGGSSGGIIVTYYTLTFDTNGGNSISKITKINGTTVDLEKYEPTKEGYEFTGWYSDKKLTHKITSIKLTKNTTVYAGWKAIKENPSTGAFPFVDVDTDDWFFEDMAYVYDNGLMNGTSATTFAPNITTTRGMIVTILYRLENEPAVSGSLPFDDVKPGSYYENAIMWAAENSIVNGYGNSLFGPDDLITREQMAAILWRYAKYAGYDVSIGEDTNILSYDDALSVSEYAVPAMQWACGDGIINGTSATTLSPQGNATRAQVAAILHRFCEKLGK